MSPEALARLREAAEHIFSRPCVNKHDLQALLDAHDTARAEGVAAERARVVADLRRKADIVSVMRSMEATTTARALRERADRYERGEHDKEGER